MVEPLVHHHRYLLADSERVNRVVGYDVPIYSLLVPECPRSKPALLFLPQHRHTSLGQVPRALVHTLVLVLVLALAQVHIVRVLVPVHTGVQALVLVHTGVQALVLVHTGVQVQAL